MVSCGSLLKSALVAFVLVALMKSSSAADPEKLAECCTKVTNQEIKEPILGYLVQKRSPPCVQAVILQTESGLFCSKWNANWVREKIGAFEKAKKSTRVPAVASPSPTSLLSLITSASTAPSPSSTSWRPAGETSTHPVHNRLTSSPAPASDMTSPQI